MQRITPKEIQKLAKYKDQTAVSIYMASRGPEFADNRSYLKYLLSSARDELSQFASYKEKHEALYPAYRLLHDREWWRFVDAGVAIFSTKDKVFAYHLAEEPDEAITVSNRFHILPLLKYLNQRGSFYLLALSAKNARLMHCDGEDIFELSVPNMPRSITDVAIREDHVLHHREQHASRPKLRDTLVALREGGKRAIKRQQKDVLEHEYLRQIHNAAHGILSRGHEPLIVAGLQRVVALYRKIDSSSYVYKEPLIANPDRLSNLELRDRARLLLGEYFAKGELKAQSQFLRLSVARPDKVVFGLKNVLKSVYQGRVQAVFVDRDSKKWGRILQSQVELHDKRHHGDTDLLDVAASEAVKRKGNVFTLEPSDLPDGSGIAAILRY